MRKFHGKYWGKYVHERIKPRFRQFGDIFLARVLPPFDRINEEASDLETRRNKELASSLVCADQDRWDGEAAMAELAFNEAMDYAVTLSSMQFSALSLFSAALYHMTEQHLIDLRQEILVDDGRDAVKPEAAIDWFAREVGLDVKGLDSWDVIDELRLVANTVKHAEGWSAKTLKEKRPQLFVFPGLEDAYVSKLRIRTPLFGQELFVTRDDFVRYHQGSVSFWSELGDALLEVTSCPD